VLNRVVGGGYLEFKMAFIPCIDIRPSAGMFFKRYVNYRNLSALFSENFRSRIFMRIRFLIFFLNFQQSRRKAPVVIRDWIGQTCTQENGIWGQTLKIYATG
jgi:hypothetical protein